jgi:hypothetical protein
VLSLISKRLLYFGCFQNDLSVCPDQHCSFCLEASLDFWSQFCCPPEFSGMRDLRTPQGQKVSQGPQQSKLCCRKI